MTPGRRGHRLVPHTVDVILEAWGPDLAACCEEAVAALVETYAERTDVEVVGRRRVRLGPAPGEQLLLDVLDEVIFTLDTSDEVPIAAEVTASADGGLDVELVLAGPDLVGSTGAVPKALARSGLRFESDPGRVSCRVLVDV